LSYSISSVIFYYPFHLFLLFLLLPPPFLLFPPIISSLHLIFLLCFLSLSFPFHALAHRIVRVECERHRFQSVTPGSSDTWQVPLKWLLLVVVPHEGSERTILLIWQFPWRTDSVPNLNEIRQTVQALAKCPYMQMNVIPKTTFFFFFSGGPENV
jgi:hypothetical protein